MHFEKSFYQHFSSILATICLLS